MYDGVEIGIAIAILITITMAMIVTVVKCLLANSINWYARHNFSTIHNSFKRISFRVGSPQIQLSIG